MTAFKTLSRIKEATEEQLAETAGKRAAKLIRKYFDKTESPENEEYNETI